jgi:hypothetical protein
VPDSLRQIFGSSNESKLSKIVGLPQDELDKRPHRSFSLSSQDFKAVAKMEDTANSLQNRLVQYQRSRAMSTPFFTPLGLDQKMYLKKLDAIAELDELDVQKNNNGVFANYKITPQPEVKKSSESTQ